MKFHETVLAKEAVEALALSPQCTVVDATLGAGGHARGILSKLNDRGTLVGIDADPSAIEHLTHLGGAATTYLRVGNFKDIDSILNDIGIGKVNAILADLGWRMEQFSGNGKGFSFLVDEPLLMTYGDPTNYACTARDIVNTWDESDIANVLYGYGEERYARRIAHKIVRERTQHPIETTFDLVKLIRGSVPASYLHGRINPATRTFQSLRIAVNDELSTLATFIDKAIARLTDNGRLAIISFHSLEDRIVKHTFKDAAEQGEGEIITKRPIVPEHKEVEQNPRARSAKLRIFQKHESKKNTSTTP